MASDSSPKTRVLVIKLSSLGDLFHALPAVHNVRIGLDAEIDWVVQSEYCDLVSCFSDVRRAIPFYRRSFFKNLPDFISDLRGETYDYILDFQGLLKSAVVGVLAKGGKVVGPSFRREGSGVFYNEVSGALNKDRHAVEENLDTVRHLGLDVMAPAFPVEFPVKRLEWEGPRVAIMPVSRWETKDWPAEYYIEVGRELLKKHGGTVLVMGSSSDSEICTHVQEGIGEGAVNLASSTSLVELGSLISRIDLLIGNDSGPLHIAAAVGTPAIAMYGPTNPRRTGPYGPRCVTLKLDLPCMPCFSRTCEEENHRCMRDLNPETVLRAATELLETYRRSDTAIHRAPSAG